MRVEAQDAVGSRSGTNDTTDSSDATSTLLPDIEQSGSVSAATSGLESASPPVYYSDIPKPCGDVIDLDADGRDGIGLSGRGDFFALGKECAVEYSVTTGAPSSIGFIVRNHLTKSLLPNRLSKGKMDMVGGSLHVSDADVANSVGSYVEAMYERTFANGLGVTATAAAPTNFNDSHICLELGYVRPRWGSAKFVYSSDSKLVVLNGLAYVAPDTFVGAELLTTSAGVPGVSVGGQCRRGMYISTGTWSPLTGHTALAVTTNFHDNKLRSRVAVSSRFEYNVWTSYSSVAAGLSITPDTAKCTGKMTIESTQQSGGASPAVLSGIVDVSVMPGLALRCGGTYTLYGSGLKPPNAFVEIIYGEKRGET